MASFISSKPFNCPVDTQDEWIEAILKAVERNGLPYCREILGLICSIIAIESTFQADPFVAAPAQGKTMEGLMKRAESELARKLGPLLSTPPVPTLYAHYKERFYPILLSCRTEGQVEEAVRVIAAELSRDADKLPNFLKHRALDGIERIAHAVRTKGSMQLNFSRARHVMKQRGESFTDRELSDYMYTTSGGVDVGVAALKPMFVQYAAEYAAPKDRAWLFFVGMDYHYGPFSSRNMMEQIRLRDLSGMKIDIDGDLLHYDEEGRPLAKISETISAVTAGFPRVAPEPVFAEFLLEKDQGYIYTDIHRLIKKAHRARFGETPFAVIGDLWMGRKAGIKHGAIWKTDAYLRKLDTCLNAIPWAGGQEAMVR
jgi:hypothetical protein